MKDVSHELFQFELCPVDQIEPWRGSNGPELHWFGLTDGHYFLQAGGTRLFEYSAEAGGRYCEYQVVRLYDDTAQLAPYALETVPEDLRQYIALDASRQWGHYSDRWSEVATVRGETRIDLAQLELACSWIGNRELESSYLSPSAKIVFWSDQDHVHIQWDNRDQCFQGAPAWSAQFGCWKLSREAFKEELRSFHHRLIAKMAERVALVSEGALGSHIHIDVDTLHREQAVRSRTIERNLGAPMPSTDWVSIREAIRTLEVAKDRPDTPRT